jgi:DNA polymerase epsilon subunit 4
MEYNARATITATHTPQLRTLPIHHRESSRPHNQTRPTPNPTTLFSTTASKTIIDPPKPIYNRGIAIHRRIASNSPLYYTKHSPSASPKCPTTTPQSRPRTKSAARSHFLVSYAFLTLYITLHCLLFPHLTPPTNTPPVARVQKIIAADPTRLHVSKNASFAIALATELFIQHLATSTYNVVKAERKPRRNVQYRDVASAIAKTDNLEFLVDVVPKTMLYKEVKNRREEKKEEAEREKREREREREAARNGGINVDVNGEGSTRSEGRTESVGDEGTQDGGDTDMMDVSEVVDADDVDDAERTESEAEVEVEAAPVRMPVPAKEDEEEEEDGAAMQIEMEMRGPRTNGSSPVVERRSGGFTAINGRK